MDQSDLQRRFLTETMRGVQQLKKEIGYNPTYFTRMVAELGPVEATRRLVRSSTPSDGFTKLWETGRLEMTVEALVLLPWYSPLFEDVDHQAARQRLEAYRFDVDGFLERRCASPPEWAKAG